MCHHSSMKAKRSGWTQRKGRTCQGHNPGSRRPNLLVDIICPCKSVILSESDRSLANDLASRRIPDGLNVHRCWVESFLKLELFEEMPQSAATTWLVILRLRGCFAKRSSYFAQDDNRHLG